jgi:hypothetical protein
MTGNPTADPNFSGVKQPAFDALVNGHTRAAAQLDRLAGDLRAQLTRLGVDTAPALRIRSLAGRVRQEATELQRRQRLVRELERDGGVGFCVPSGTFWQLSEPRTPHPQPGQAPPSDPLDLSYELWDANFLPPPYAPPGWDFSIFSAREKAVLSWIQAHQEIILREARARNISPKAIVAAIAWEALVNVKAWNPLPPVPGLAPHLSNGPGKVHIDTTVVNQIEARRYLPIQGVWERRSILNTPEGAIKYIAAIMGAYADVADRVTNHDPHKDIRNNVPVLVNLYQGSDLDRWDRYLRNGGLPTYGNTMATWAADPHNQKLLDAAVTALDGSVPDSPHPGPRLPPTVTPTPKPGTSPTPP